MGEGASVQRRKAQIFSAFDRVASRYDLLSGLNPGYHKHLQWSAERLEVENEGEGSRILDPCCGTGLSTEPLVRLYPKAAITGLDLSDGMLEKARKKESLRSVVFSSGDGMDPAATGAKGPFDAILMAYGISSSRSRSSPLAPPTSSVTCAEACSSSTASAASRSGSAARASPTSRRYRWMAGSAACYTPFARGRPA
jgi:SAM-dependent methyltransferase